MWDEFRQQMPVTERWAYFDHAAVAPLPRPTIEAISQRLAQSSHDGTAVWSDWYKSLQTTRAEIAELFGADPGEIAFVHNTTHGISLVAEGLAWREGDNVVTLEDEFPSNQYAWLALAASGVATRRVTPAPDVDIVQQLLAACDERTRLVAVSWVSYSSGRRIDLDRLGRALRAQGVLLFVDAIQGLGVFPLDVSRTAVDFFAADGHKWMLGPEGAGLFYVRRELIDQLRPIGVGWHSVPHAFDYSRVEFALRADARRFEGGSHNMLGLCGLAASLGLLRRFGLGPQDHRLADRVLDVAAHVRSRVAEVGGEIAGPVDLSEQSGIVSFTLPGCDSVALRRRCLEAGVVVSCRDGRLRVAAHAYNNDDDIDRLIDVLRSS